MSSIAISLEVDDKGSVVVKKFTNKTVSKVKQMSDKSIGHVKRLSAKFTKTLGGAIGKVGRALTSLKTLAIGALAGWGVTKVLGEFATFETALVDMGKVTSESYDSIKKKIMELPPELGSATELTRGYYNVISAGVKGAANQLDTLTTASKQAKTAHADQAQVILGLTSVMDAFKVESMGAADTLQIMEKTGKTTVGQLIPVIGELSSGSAALDISLDAMGAAFAAVTLQSGGTEKAATQYKALLTSLLAPSEEMTNLLSRYGGAQEAIKQIGFGGVLELIKNKTKGNAAATKKLLGSVEAYLGFLGASANNMQTYNQNLEEQKNKTGAVDKAWKDYMKTLNAVWDTFKNTIGKQLIEIGEKLAPAIKKVIERTGEWLKANKKLITGTIGGWIENIISIMGKLKDNIQSTFDRVQIWYYMNEDLIKSKIKEFIERFIGACETLVPVIEKITGAVKWLVKKFISLGEHLGITAAKIVGFFEKAWNKISGFVTKIKNLASKPITIVTKFLGKGSSTLPLSEKVKEVDTLIQNYASKVSATTAESKVKFTATGAGEGKMSASGAITKVQNDWNKTAASIESNVPKATIDVSPAVAAIQKVEDHYHTVVGRILHTMARTQYFINRAGMSAMGAGFAHRAMGAMMEGFRDVLDRAKFIKKIEIELIGQYYEKHPGYAAGTDYVPRTGLYELHQGEIVIPPQQSNQIRNQKGSSKSISSNTTVGDVHVHIPPNAAPQSAQDWRYITREVIIPELKKAVY